MRKSYFLFIFCKLILVTSFFASFVSLNLTSCSCSNKQKNTDNQNLSYEQLNEQVSAMLPDLEKKLLDDDFLIEITEDIEDEFKYNER